MKYGIFYVILMRFFKHFLTQFKSAKTLGFTSFAELQPIIITYDIKVIIENSLLEIKYTCVIVYRDTETFPVMLRYFVENVFSVKFNEVKQFHLEYIRYKSFIACSLIYFLILGKVSFKEYSDFIYQKDLLEYMCFMLLISIEPKYPAI